MDHAALAGGVPAAVIGFAVRGSVVLLAAFLLARALRRRSASLRHAVWVGALLAQLGIPLLAWTLPGWMPSLPVRLDPVVGVLDATAAAPIPAAGSPGERELALRSGAALRDGAAAAAAGWGVQGALAAIWLAGVLLVLGRLGGGMLMMSRAAARSGTVLDGRWLALAQRAACELGLRRPVRLLCGSGFDVPVTWGIVYPVVVLPAGADAWAGERRRFVLLHELEHVRRHDALTLLLAELARAAFWFNPLVHLAIRRMLREREHACDDRVLAAGARPTRYAQALLDMARSLRPDSRTAFAVPLGAARSNELEGRLLRVLASDVPRASLRRRAAAGLAGCALLIVLPLALLRPEPVIPAPESVDRSAFAADSVLGVPLTWTCGSPPPRAVGGALTHERINGRLHSYEALVAREGGCLHGLFVDPVSIGEGDRSFVLAGPGAGVFLHEARGGRERRLLTAAGPDGRPTLSYWIDGKPAALDAAADAWVRRILPQVVRESGVDVAARVRRARARDGFDAALEQAAAPSSAGARERHLQALAAQSTTADELRRVAAAANRALSGEPASAQAVRRVVDASARRTLPISPSPR
ncbi:MAG TPA: M56 family metallopeptidase [Longimicrobium sp.]|nr:M56 family metallopeptidase [Longimicrobium sp.]